MLLNRHKNSVISSWWWTVDHLTLLVLFIIIAFSAVMVATASPAVAERIGVESFYFVRRQLCYLALSLVIIFIISCLSTNVIKLFCVCGFAFCILSLIIVLFNGIEIKGAKRWLYIAGLSVQPSEFVKPFFAVLTGWILSLRYKYHKFPSFRLALLLYLPLILLIISQPDFGMVVVISFVWMGQLFLAGLSLAFVISCIILLIAGLLLAYMFLPHVAHRINSFMDPSSNNSYQIKKSIEAFINGGLYGKGPGEGTVKQLLPDSHTDFIFAVIGEELGIITCIIVVLLFGFIVIRSFIRLSNENNVFVIFATVGLLMQFGIQSIINIGVTLHLFPTKGMTLPFISYGGSSMIAVAMTVGMILAMTRRRYGMIKIGSKEYIL
ncbi:Cell division protein FtsW [Rickettsiales bacterium Ac37b]|nr:Cell division protein FtsW [Rickettsiales bacterium Ac37b]